MILLRAYQFDKPSFMFPSNDSNAPQQSRNQRAKHAGSTFRSPSESNPTALPPGGYSESVGGGVDTLVDRRSPLQLDSPFVQQTKDQIREIVSKIAASAQSPLAPQDFIGDSLPRIVTAMGATGAALWQWRESVGWSLVGATNLPSPLLDSPVGTQSISAQITGESTHPLDRLDQLESEIALSIDSSDRLDDKQTAAPESENIQPSQRHAAILEAVRKERQPILIPPEGIELRRDRPTNPTDQLLILSPLPLGTEQGVLWLEVVQPPSGGPASQRGYLRFVAQMADLMAEYFKSHRLRVLERDRHCLTIAEQTMSQLAISTHQRRSLGHLMNVLREHAAAEHVFLLRRESIFQRWRVVAAAGLMEIDSRSDGIQKIARCAPAIESLLPNGGSIKSDQLGGDPDSRDPDLVRWLSTFAVHEAKWLKLADASDAEIELQATGGENSKPSPTGKRMRRTRRRYRTDVALLVSWSGTDRPPDRIEPQLTLIARLGLASLQIPWWKTAISERKTTKRALAHWLSPLTWPRTIQAIVILAILASILAVPVPIKLQATAILHPSVQQHVFAPGDAVVEEIFVEHGQSVSAGQTLMQLRSLALESEYETAIAEQLKNAQRRSEIEHRLHRSSELTSAQRDELECERETLNAMVSVENMQLSILKKQIDDLQVRADMDGVIATWNVQSNLKDRPLKSGQWLLSLHNPNASWILEASLPERDIDAFRHAVASRNATEAFATLTNMPQTPLKVNYLPNSIPRIEHRFSSTRDPWSPGLLCVRFAVDQQQIPRTAAISGATARISIPTGKAPLAWALGRDFFLSLWAKARMWI